MAEYHLAVGKPWEQQAAGSGKGTRATLVLTCARSVGAEENAAVPGAVAVELVHGFSLLHDDIMDRDRLRRHQPSAWVEFGVPAALLTGDALLAQALRVLGESGSHRAVSVLVDALDGLMRGQSMDMAFEQRADVTLVEYRSMAEGKTGALLGAACALGAVLGGAQEPVVSALRRFGQHAGIAFQCADDILGLWGDPRLTGKPVGRDLTCGKKTYPLLAALAAEGPAGDRVRHLYACSGGCSTKRVEELLEAIKDAGGRAAAEREAAAQVHNALRHLDSARLSEPARRELESLTYGLADRCR
ncbi:polyprenyl synthetase family protein [Streptomyces sp. NPDC102406]|uniref:polyprenyl synthetase family protein n=1 Tax=Streptomyces sp. NPDC102406 TaxID=3366171 RepID=UPI00380136AA